MVLWTTSIIYGAVFFYFTWFKLRHFGYDNLDLAIFNSSLWNLVHGFGLTNAIHPPSYLGDHFSPFLFLLTPYYYLFQSPLCLLWLQVITLAACVWPLYLIARKRLSAVQSVIIGLVWLANPVLQNMTMFEFSLVPFAMFFLLWSWYWYEKKHSILWLVFVILALSCREDIALVIIMFSVIAWIDKRSWLWKVLPVLISISWFVVAQKIIDHVALNGSYKFSIYYQWIFGSSFWQLLQHLFTWGNVEMILGLLFPLFFLPLLKPKFLLFLLAPLASMMLTPGGGSELVLKTHYGGLLLWPLFLAVIYWLPSYKLPLKIKVLFPHWLFMYLLIIVATAYSCLTYGSLLPQLLQRPNNERTTAYQQALNVIPQQAAVASTYSFLTPLSSRHLLQVLPYAYGGKGQFALTEYTLDSQVEYLAIDWQEMIYAQAHYPSRYPDQVNHQQMQENLTAILKDFIPLFQRGNITVMKRQKSAEQLAVIQPSTAPTLSLAAVRQIDDELVVTVDGPLPPKELYLETTQGDMTWRWPLAYGLYEPASSTSTKKIIMPLAIADKNSPITIKLYSWNEAQLFLNNLNSLSVRWSDQSVVAESTATR
jgi:uncharacterized membrane protein